MFDWLFEGRSTVYLILGITALILLYLFWKQQNRRIYLIGAVIAFALMGLYYFLDFSVETDSEQIVRKLKEMADGIGRNDLDATFNHISEHFQSPGGKSKKQLRDFTRETLKSGMVRAISVWDYRFRTPPDRQSGHAEVIFKFKPTGGIDGPMQGAFFDCVSEFDHDPVHGWRLVRLHLFFPNAGLDGPEVPWF